MAQLLIQPKKQFLDSNGDPLVGGKVYSYDAGTTTPRATYTDKDAGTPNTNPIILDARGEADVWLDSGSYKISVFDSDDVLIYTVDDIKSINDATITEDLIADDSISTDKIQDSAVTRDKLAGGLRSIVESQTITENYTATDSDDLIYIDAISQDITVGLPPAASSSSLALTLVRIDDHRVKTDDFVDGDVTVLSDVLNISSHPFTDLQRVQLTTTGVLPTGLALATDYWVILNDSNNIQLADSLANAIIDSAVDISAASGGGTHTITSVKNIVTVDAYLTEEINGELTHQISREYEGRKYQCNGLAWYGISFFPKSFDALDIGVEADGMRFRKNGAQIDVLVGDTVVSNFNSGGLLGLQPNSANNGAIVDLAVTTGKIAANSVTRDKLVTTNLVVSSSSGSYSSNATGYTTVTNLDIDITCQGRPILIFVSADNSSDVSQIVPSSTNSTFFRILRDNTTTVSVGGVGAAGAPLGSKSFMAIDNPGSGSTNYKFQMRNDAGAANHSCTTMTLTAIELL